MWFSAGAFYFGSWRVFGVLCCGYQNGRRHDSSCGRGGPSSASEDSDVEPGTDLPRRGRRQAIFDSKASNSQAKYTARRCNV